MMPLKRLVFVTGSSGKLDHIREILTSTQDETIDIESCDLDLPEIQGTTQEIAIEKCRRAAELIGGPVITEDTALCFAALNGLTRPLHQILLAPARARRYAYIFVVNIFAPRFFARREGLNRMLDGFQTRAAWALCTLAYSAGPDTEPILFEGRTDGRIVPPRGTPMFGWGPVFETDDNGLTYTEMEATQRHAVSHQARALQQLRAYLQAQGELEGGA